MDKDRMHDRHNVPKPKGADETRASGVVVVGDGAYMDGFKERIHDLFKTQAGLANHVQPIQDLFQSLNKAKDIDDDRKKVLARKAYDQLIKAAEHAGFDFTVDFHVDNINCMMHIERKGPKIISYFV